MLYIIVHENESIYVLQCLQSRYIVWY